MLSSRPGIFSARQTYSSSVEMTGICLSSRFTHSLKPVGGGGCAAVTGAGGTNGAGTAPRVPFTSRLKRTIASGDWIGGRNLLLRKGKKEYALLRRAP